jgi:hypothetical protein
MGVGALVGGSVTGSLYAFGQGAIVSYAFVLEAVALVLFVVVRRRLARR